MSRLSFILIFLMFYTICSGQEYSYQHYTISDGLPQTQITDIFQDSKGFIWVGTKGGVSRFDGKVFENFDIKDGLTSRIVCDISEGRDGKIYVLCDHGLSVFDGNKFKPYPFEGNIRVYMNYAYVEHDLAGNIWISSRIVDNRIFMKFLNGIYTAAAQELSLSDTLEVNSLFFDELNNSLLVSTELNGIFIVAENLIKNILPDFTKIHIFQKKSDTLIFQAEYQNKGERKLYKCSVNIPNQIIELADSVGSLFQTISTNRFLFSAFNNDYFKEYSKGKIISHQKKYERLNASLIDIEGNFWAGSETGLYRRKSNAFINFTSESGINKNIWSIVEDDEEKIWFASFTEGISMLNNNKFTLINKKNFPTTRKAFYRGAIQTKNKEILFTFEWGVMKYDGSRYSLLTGLPKAATLFLYEDTLRNRLLISSANNGLIIREFNGNVKKINISPGPTNEYISTINMDKLGRYWLGGFYGLSILKGDSVIQLPSKELPYSAGAISSYRDSLDNLWFGTTSGLYVYDYKTFRKIESPHIKTNIMSLAGMAGNKLFIGMVDGIGILDLEDFYSSGNENVLFYNESNGFLGKECKQNGVLTDSKGFTWVATSDRVVKIDPTFLSKTNYRPKVYIQSVEVLSGDSAHLIFAGNKTVSDSSYHLSWKQKDFRFDYHGILHSAPEEVKYKHLLKGYNKDWSDVSRERYASYTNLKYGDYEFQVMASNGDGVWNEEPAVFKFTIQPALWQTPIFIVLLNLIIVAVIVSIILALTRRKRKKLEASLRLEKQFTELQLKTIKNQMDPHFTFNAINSLGSLIFREKKEKAYDYLVNFSNLIRTTVESSDKVSRSLKEEIKFVENYMEMQNFRFKDKIEFNIEIDDQIDMEMQVPRMVIQIHVENALKHGLAPCDYKGKLDVRALKNSGDVIIEIIDNGVGRKKAKELNKNSTKKGLQITDQYYSLINKFNKNKITQEIIDLCDGSGESVGTKVSIHIPLDINYEF